METELVFVKQGFGKEKPKAETKEKIKSMISEYIKEMEKNLKNIEGLDVKERKELL